MFKGANYIKNKAGIIQDYFGFDAAKVLEVKSNDEIKVYFYDFKVLGRTSPTKSIMCLEHDDLYHFLDTYSLHSVDGVEEIERPNEHAEDNKFLLGLLISKYKEKKEVAKVLGVSPAQITHWLNGEKMSPKRIKQCTDITKGITNDIS
tara:strand:+ start:51 stop:494 length:444 start_codon:yes stop_codon:yes gene_type:complete